MNVLRERKSVSFSVQRCVAYILLGEHVVLELQVIRPICISSDPNVRLSLGLRV